ncbi:alginate lyase family protein [Paenibacillus hodogayensis]|uniref:Alginate lyase family protein n=1 Tax=Paenibacillus hodogayensis TaxID=279208 RepID=A0ABV5VTK7_9BACL
MLLKDVLQVPVSPERFYETVRARLEAEQERRGFSFSERAAYIRREFPEVAEKTIAAADQALEGRLILPATNNEPYFVGNPPDWYADPLFDAEYVVCLNRMPHWRTLVYAYWLTGDERYGRKVLQEVVHWVETCERPEIPVHDPEETIRIYRGIFPWNALSSGIRMFGSWAVTIEGLIGLMTPRELEQIAVSVFQHGELLAEACPILWPHASSNHYIMESLGLLYLSGLFPEFCKSAEWSAFAIRELERCSEAQLTPSGGQVEGCPHYHNLCVSLFSQTLEVARRQGHVFPATYTDRIAKAIDYSLYSMRPTGTGVPWGDSDADHYIVVALLDAYSAVESKEWMEVCRELVGPEKMRNAALKHSNVLWEGADPQRLLDDIDAGFAGARADALPLTGRQTELHQVMMRSSWKKDALSLFFACGSPFEYAHRHMDLMSFDFTALGRPLVVDPGRYCYREDEDRRLFKSATWHNTLTINNREPFDFISSWKYGPQKEGKIERVFETAGATAVQAVHANYEPVVHRRLVAMVADRYVLVLDAVAAVDPIYTVQLFYHLDSTRVVLDTDRRSARTDDPGMTNLLLRMTDNVVGELLPGKVSDYQDAYRPSTRICLRDSTRTKKERLYATLLLPYGAGEEAPDADAPLVVEEAGSIRCVVRIGGERHEVTWNGEEQSFAWTILHQ